MIMLFHERHSRARSSDRFREGTFRTMQDGAGTLSAPLEPTWALVAWDTPRLAASTWSGPPQPGVLARFWGRTRDSMVARLRPLIEKTVRKAGIVELIQLVAAMERFEQSMMSHARSSYDRADLDEIILDPEISRHHEGVHRAARVVMKNHPWWLGKPRARNLFPREALNDPAVLVRVDQALANLDELSALLQAAARVAELADSDLNRSLEVSADDEEQPNPCWWAYDSSIPVALAERLLAGRRSAFLPTLVRVSRRYWTAENMRRAVLDWADAVSDFAGLFASIPGVVGVNVTEDRKLDLELLLKQHQQSRQSSAAHFEQSLASLNNN